MSNLYSLLCTQDNPGIVREVNILVNQRTKFEINLIFLKQYWQKSPPFSTKQTFVQDFLN